jgi:membrane-associated protease RseP (regulator of RpoE activity)
MKKLFFVMVTLAFILGVSSFGFAASDEFSGVVTKISGDKVTVKDAKGQEKTVTTDSKALKVGEKVMIKGTKIQNLDIKSRKQAKANKTPGSKAGIRSDEEGDPVQARPAGSVRSK